QIDPHHYNQAVMLYSKEGFDKEAIKEVFSKIQEHHDVLRITYEREGTSGQVVQVAHGLDFPLSLREYDLRNRKNRIAEFKTKINEIQAGINLEIGPLMKLGLFHLTDGDRLLIVIHHLVIDGVSWRILFEDIETLYSKYKRGEKLVLPPKTDSFKTWAEKLQEYANNKTFLKEKTYWQKIESVEAPSIPKDFDVDDNNIKDTGSVSFTLREEETELLLTKVNKIFRTEINDILLTALAMSIKKTFGHPESGPKFNRVLIALEGHGREAILEDIDIGRTAGWFTGVYPVALDITHTGDPGRQIKEIKETLRRIPNKGVGHGILKYLTREENKKEIEFKLKPQIGFNYLGQFDADVKQISSFEIAKESAGNSQGLNNKREYVLNVSGMTSNKRLTMTYSYNEKHFKPGTMTALIRNFETELRRLITFCCSKENPERTPADFTYKGLSIDSIDRLTREYPGIEDIYTLTPMQEGLLFHTLADDSSYSYFEQASYRLRGKLDVYLVEKSLNELFKRHDILRTAFVYKDIERPVQLVLTGRVIDFYYEDISKLGEREEKENSIAEFKKRDKDRSFDLSKGTLMRVSIRRMEESEFEFTWSYHHILMDGWCLGIINSEFFEIYTSYLENRPYRLPAVKPYRTYIQWLEKHDMEESARYWQSYLDSYEEQAGVPKIMALANGESRYRNEEISVVLDRERTAGLNRLAAGNHVTLNIVIQTLWGILLGKYNGKDDVVFGAVVSGRPFELEGVESILGLFINTIPVRIRFEGNMKFYVLLQRIQEDALASEPYHYHPLADIQSMSALKQNLIDHIFIFENYPIAEQIEGYGSDGNQKNELRLKLSNIDVFEQTNYDFNVMFSGTEQLKIALRYNGNVYDSRHVKRIADHLNFIIDQVIADSSRPISDIEIIFEATRKEVLNHFNENLHEEFEILPIQSRLADVFRKYKTNTAIECKNTRVTYAELEHRAACISQWIAGKNIPVGSFIGIYSEDKIAIISAIIGVLQRGCIFVPLDTTLPGKRVENMIRLTNMQVIVTDNVHETILTGMKEKIFDATHICVLNDSFYPPGELDGNKNPGITYSPEDKIYVYFTSGTTGAPNAIVGRNKSLVQFLQWEIETFAVAETYRVSQLTAVGFDAFLRDVFVPLLAGGIVSIPGYKEILLDGNALIQWLDKKPINLVHCVPSLFRIINSEQLTPASFPHLKYVLLSGEPINPNELQGWYRIFGRRIQLVNYYGPTETTMIKTFHFIDMSDIEAGKIAAGRPIRGARVLILDRYMKICARGIMGEIYIRTAYSTHGYLDNPGLNAQRFIKNPFSAEEGDLIYKTGDLGRELENGEIEVLGRIDRQVKIRGVRIELENIENCLLKHNQIEKLIVMNRKTGNDENYLCAYIVYKKPEPPIIEKIPTSAELREFLAKELPNYMIPSHFVKIEKIPLTANGKIDRKALEKSGEIQDTGALYAPPTTEMEKKMAGIWAELLKLAKVSINDNFFELGGNSLTTLAMTSKLKEIGCEVTLGEVLSNLTVKKLAAVIDVKNISPALAEENVAAPLLSQLDCIERLNKGGKRKNIFIIHPMHGMVNPYRELAVLLETEYNVYGIQARGLKPGTKMSESPGQMITDYVQQILSVQKDGPYIIAGYCIGTIISYEIAIKLERMGRPVEKLILFDSNAFFSRRFAVGIRALEYSPRFIKRWIHLFQERKFKKATQDENPGKIQERSSEEMTDDGALRKETIAQNMRVFRDYILLLEVIKAPILVLLAEASIPPGTTEANFSRMTKSKATVIKVPGDHDSIFEKPNVENLSEAIKKVSVKSGPSVA
ncbi:MAG: amino acid adenylation domain-containing protein, partial [Candidatus Aminicenantes bacterium]|nr:amino acid adenylation domain-containing protein [Candidatus Aminicenantes bacterium]